jgi:hypothetical protein
MPPFPDFMRRRRKTKFVFAGSPAGPVKNKTANMSV